MTYCENHPRRPATNKKYKLCDECNYIRLHGESKQDVYAQRAASKPKKVYVLKQSVVKQQTKKQSVRSQQLSSLKTEIELEAIQDGRYYCEGCGKSYPGLDKSHILSVGQRKDLELEKNNIHLFCRDCHNDWESWDIERMSRLLTFEADLYYIFDQDFETFGRIMNKIFEYMRWNSDKDTEIVKKLQKILKKFGENVASN